MALVVTWFEREEGNVWFGLVVVIEVEIVVVGLTLFLMAAMNCVCGEWWMVNGDEWEWGAFWPVCVCFWGSFTQKIKDRVKAMKWNHFQTNLLLKKKKHVLVEWGKVGATASCFALLSIISWWVFFPLLFIAPSFPLSFLIPLLLTHTIFTLTTSTWGILAWY